MIADDCSSLGGVLRRDKSAHGDPGTVNAEQREALVPRAAAGLPGVRQRLASRAQLPRLLLSFFVLFFSISSVYYLLFRSLLLQQSKFPHRGQ